MKKIIGIIFLAPIIIFLALGIARTQAKEEVLSINKIQAAEGIPVLTMKAGLENVVESRRFYGDVKAAKQAVVTSKLMDRIDQMLVRVGDRVVKGQTIVKFDTTVSMASVIQARLAMENASRDFERLQVLFDQGAISRQMYDGAKLQLDIASENYATSRSTVELYAPISGTVARIDFKAGDLSHPGDILLTILSNNKLVVEFDVPQTDRKILEKGQKIVVSTQNAANIAGTITEVSLVTNLESRMFKIYGEIPATGGVYPGVLATVDVTIAERTNVITVPINAVLGDDNAKSVVVVQNNLAHFRQVKLGLSGENNIEVISGLTQGEIIAVHGHTNLMEGTKVKAVQD